MISTLATNFTDAAEFNIWIFFLQPLMQPFLLFLRKTQINTRRALFRFRRLGSLVCHEGLPKMIGELAYSPHCSKSIAQLTRLSSLSALLQTKRHYFMFPLCLPRIAASAKKHATHKQKKIRVFVFPPCQDAVSQRQTALRSPLPPVLEAKDPCLSLRFASS